MAEIRHSKRGKAAQDLTGFRSGRLVAVKYLYRPPRNSAWLCRCDCGNLKEVSSGSLLSGNKKSCGCAPVKNMFPGNGEYRPEFKCWMALRHRCLSPKKKEYHRYGGRGIKVCDRWSSGEDGKSGFDCFVEDMGRRPSKRHTVDRIDNDGNYEPGNCRWATQKEQAANMSTTLHMTVKGETRLMSEWSAISGIPVSTLTHRFHSGWPEKKLFSPVRKYTRKSKT